ncbi:Carbon monoxide dehydrogenase subunit G [Natronoarchaeum philippinense]|uniref:Carbon monoxide dehydrogenase subunit G n=1 Tax=Natronoarchaeum philippinense TaxID=558529 RepID=A0A285NVG3_NATPI|nr:SRPBCC family protein [Natronoarchaeum philippinense]SNZ13228.1 Carbon monoxide dehydrogenase subunit G [Natronoarchaeum philippinense]
MTVRVERTFELPVEPERVWEFIADPEKRARSISVVSDYELDDADGRRATWHVDLPVPLLDRTAAVRTEDVERRAPEYVEFVGRSKVLRVTGEHEIEATEDGSRLHNRFVVDGRLPGVERFFERNLDDELRNLETTLRDDLGVEQ